MARGERTETKKKEGMAVRAKGKRAEQNRWRKETNVAKLRRRNVGGGSGARARRGQGKRCKREEQQKAMPKSQEINGSHRHRAVSQPVPHRHGWRPSTAGRPCRPHLPPSTSCTPCLAAAAARTPGSAPPAQCSWAHASAMVQKTIEVLPAPPAFRVQRGGHLSPLVRRRHDSGNRNRLRGDKRHGGGGNGRARHHHPLGARHPPQHHPKRGERHAEHQPLAAATEPPSGRRVAPPEHEPADRLDDRRGREYRDDPSVGGRRWRAEGR